MEMSKLAMQRGEGFGHRGPHHDEASTEIVVNSLYCVLLNE